MKNIFRILALAMALCLLTASAFALNYTGNLGNASTFETMTEVRANAPAAMQPYSSRGVYAPHPVMESFPGDTAYVYRSADMYGYNGAARLNTSIVVYTDKTFASKDEAKAYIADMGLIDIIEEARGSITLVTPSNPEAGFGAEDQKNYYKLQTAIFGLNAGGMIDGARYSYVDAVYYGTYGFYYVIGIDGGATFVNNYVASNFDSVARIAGMLLVNGKMDRIRTVASHVPAYLVNAPQTVVEKYKAADGADSVAIKGNKEISFNVQFPVRQVVSVKADDVDLKAIVKDAYYSVFAKSVRGQEVAQGLYTAGTPYQAATTSDCVPYSLSVRNPIFNGVTPDGIHEFTRVSDQFAGIVTESGEYLQTWYEYIPEEMLDGTADAGSIPMILCCHGGGDDPRQYVDGQGYLELAGKERIFIVAPEKSALHVNATNGISVLSQALPELVKLMLETYPQIDASRVYVTGYSMGSLATFDAIFGCPEIFAAAYPQAGVGGVAPTEAQVANWANVNLPVTISTSEYDSNRNIDEVTKCIVPEFYNLMSVLKTLNDLEPLPEFDGETYPRSGYAADLYTQYVLNGEFTKHSWYFLDENEVPMVGLTYIDGIQHCLYPEYAQMVWDFCKHYSRDLETGAVVYDPYVR